MDKKIFLPTLYPLDRNMVKVWFVQYLDTKGAIQKKYGRLNHLDSLGDRMIEADKLIRELTIPYKAEKRQRNDLISNLSTLLEYKRPSLAHRSYTSYLSVLNFFAQWYRKYPAMDDNILPVDYIQHLQKRGLHNNHMRKIKSVLSSLFRELVARKKYPYNPFADVRIKKVKAQSLLPFTIEQIGYIKVLVSIKDPQLWDACQFEYYLFFRPCEIRLLKIENIHFEEMMIIAGVEITKDDDVVKKAIPEPFKASVLKYRDYPKDWYIFGKGGKPGPQPLSINYLNKRHRNFLTQLGIGNRYSFYSWVYTGVKRAAMSGIPLKQLQLQKGHCDLEMFDRYLKNIGVEECTQLIQGFPSIDQ